MDQIIIKITITQLESLTRYLSLVNYSLQQTLNIVYLERIYDGVLMIVSELELFKALYHPITDQVRDLALKFQNDDSSLLSVDDIITEDKFPDKGLIFHFEAQNEVAQDAIPILNTFYEKTIPEITVDMPDNHHLIVNFTTFAAFRFQINLLYMEKVLHKLDQQSKAKKTTKNKLK
jgi:hypothetical protein